MKVNFIIKEVNEIKEKKIRTSEEENPSDFIRFNEDLSFVRNKESILFYKKYKFRSNSKIIGVESKNLYFKCATRNCKSKLTLTPKKEIINFQEHDFLFHIDLYTEEEIEKKSIQKLEIKNHIIKNPHQTPIEVQKNLKEKVSLKDIRSIKNQNYTSEINSINDILKGEYTKTTDNTKFLRYYLLYPKLIIIYFSENMKDYLNQISNFDSIHADGTFNFTFNGVTQLFVLIYKSKTKKRGIPILFSFLEDKSEEAYFLMFQSIKFLIPKLYENQIILYFHSIFF
jgi:hypothetical protein